MGKGSQKEDREREEKKKEDEKGRERRKELLLKQETSGSLMEETQSLHWGAPSLMGEAQPCPEVPPVQCGRHSPTLKCS